MRTQESIDPSLRALGGRARYQLLQAFVINLGNIGATYQLLGNIFIGRNVEEHQCASPPSSSPNSSLPFHEDLPWQAGDNVSYGECTIYSTGNATEPGGDAAKFPCLFGHQYDYRRELSFRTEFDLVCDHRLLGGLVQTLVILGQGVGAVLSSIVSDRFGRKRTLVCSQLGLFVLGTAVGLSPSYVWLCIFKFTSGCFQQGVVGTLSTMTIELFPMEYRSMQPLSFSVLWGVGASSMTVFAVTMKHLSWRYLQFAMSSVSLLLAAVQMWYLDESLRWLLANGKKEAAIRVIERASKTNGKKLSEVLQTLQDSETIKCDPIHVSPSSTEEKDNDDEDTRMTKGVNGVTEGDSGTSPDVVRSAMERSLSKKQAEKLTVFDIFRHWFLLRNALVIWLAWFTCAFSFFTLYMMSTSLVGNRFLNYFLTALMEIPPGFLLYYLVDSKGRKFASRVFYIIAGVGLLCGGIFRIFEDIAVLGTMSVVMAMVGMVGASGLFGAVFFLTPELFPTNMRNQSIGVSSFAGRMGGMLAPFMNNVAEVAVWAPGAMIGALCFTVVGLFHFLPETKGRELPHTVQDIKDWFAPAQEKEKEEKDSSQIACTHQGDHSKLENGQLRTQYGHIFWVGRRRDSCAVM